MQINGTTLGTIDVPNYSIIVKPSVGGNVHELLDNDDFSFTYDLTKTRSPTVSIWFVIDLDSSGTFTIDDFKNIFKNKEELTVSGTGLGAFKFVALSGSLKETTLEQNILRGSIEGKITVW